MNKPEPPPPYGFQAPQQQPTPTVVVQYGPESQRLACPYCHHNISTRIKSEPVMKTHLLALLLCFFLCWPCVCVPYCMDSCQSTAHYCPNCNAYLGSYNQ